MRTSLRILTIGLLAVVITGCKFNREFKSNKYYDELKPDRHFQQDTRRRLPIRRTYRDRSAPFNGVIKKDLPKGLNWNGVQSRVSKLGGLGRMCARGVRTTLNTLLGSNVGSGPSACRYAYPADHGQKHSTKLDQFTHNTPFRYEFVKDKAKSAQRHMGDVVVCYKNGRCNPDSGDHGHIEFVGPGKPTFSSDGKQNGPICGRGSYSPAYVFRLKKRDGSAITDLQKVVDFLFPSAVAESTSFSPQDPPEEAVERIRLEAKRLTKSVVPQRLSIDSGYVLEFFEAKSHHPVADHYQVLKKEKGKESKVSKKLNDVYAAIAQIPEESEQRMLALAYVQHWINKIGKDIAQKMADDHQLLHRLQKEAYLDAGLKLPEHYNILSEE